MGQSLGVRIVREIAAADGSEPTDLGFALGQYVDVEALEQLADHSEGDWSITFEVPGYEVTVHAGERISVEPIELSRVH